MSHASQGSSPAGSQLNPPAIRPGVQAGSRVTAITHPSLALVKYWGKRPGPHNLPATTSLAVSLAELQTTTSVRLMPASGGQGDDWLLLDGKHQDPGRFASFFSAARRLYPGLADWSFQVESQNNFPAAAGLASSSSGFAALALCLASLSKLGRSDRREGSPRRLGCGLPQEAVLAGQPGQATSEAPASAWLSPSELRAASALARVGSASAARAVYGGWTRLAAGARYASPLYPATHWPKLRVLVLVLSHQAKEQSSRSAMGETRASSPYYPAWLRDSRRLSRLAAAAIADRDIERLGSLARLSYSRMHASALAADPPILYWLPESVAAIRVCASLRAQGIGVWETMDAGPQVKLICHEGEVSGIRQRLLGELPTAKLIETAVGEEPRLILEAGSC